MNDTLQQFLQIGIVGVALSFIVQVIKQKYDTDSNATKGLTVLLAVLLGVLYYFLVGTAIWEAIVGVLAAASTFYALFLKSDSK